MKILFVAPIFPHPPVIGSAVITLNQLRVLSQRHRIDLISFKNRTNSSDLGELTRWCNKIELVERPPRWQVLLSMLSRVLIDPHPDISRFRSAEMYRVVAAHLSGGHYDVVLFQTLQSAQFRPDWYSGPAIWSLEDPLALKTEKMLAMYPWYSRPLHRKRVSLLRQYDLKQARRFDCVTFVNREDAREYMNSVPGACADFVPHGISEESVSGAAVSRQKGMIVITGNMYHLPNVDAVGFFCGEVFPLICDQEPSANLWLIGAKPVAAVRKWANDSRIKVTGFVPDISGYLRQAVVSVCPVRLRVGTQTKILEALSCGTPVVTSSAGNYGIAAISGKDLYVTDNPREFANHVVSLLAGDRWNEFSDNGRRFVREKFSWESSAAKLEQVMERVVQDRRPKPISA